MLYNSAATKTVNNIKCLTFNITDCITYAHEKKTQTNIYMPTKQQNKKRDRENGKIRKSKNDAKTVDVFKSDRSKQQY